eukprot:45985-Amphidinium_carterae.1
MPTQGVVVRVHTTPCKGQQVFHPSNYFCSDGAFVDLTVTIRKQLMYAQNVSAQVPQEPTTT